MKQPPFLSSFGRNRGRRLRPHQQMLVETLLPTLAIKANADAIRGDRYPRIALEIGFGGGEHLLAQAAHHPETLFIGAEPFINGVAKCLVGIEAQKLSNIRLFTEDVRKLLLALPEHCLERVFILFPDPWPKARHHKRRLINQETLDMLARVHQPGGRLLIATDHEDYSVWIFEQLQRTPHYRWTAQSADDFRLPPADWTQTKYQRKTTAAGRAPVFIECIREDAMPRLHSSPRF